MHGRVKVKTTAQQQEEKRKEQAKKVAKLKYASACIFQKSEKGIYDQEGLLMCTKILSYNSDFYTMWNYRKNYFIHQRQVQEEAKAMKCKVVPDIDKVPDQQETDSIKKDSESKAEELTSVDINVQLEQELQFIQDRLKENPKSYSCWNHRCWVTDQLGDHCDWRREMELCDLFLQFDERNFHCWDYRRFVVPHCKHVTREAELSRTQQLISCNFSNYSSWHYRSMLLTNARLKDDKILKEELELTQKAYFTEPNDQSAWFYHRWLIGRKQRPLELITAHVTPAQVTCVLTNPLPNDEAIQVEVDSQVVSAPNWSHARLSRHACVYTCDLAIQSSVVIRLGNQVATFRNISGDAAFSFYSGVHYDRVFEGDDKYEMLQNELEACKDLEEYEEEDGDGNKWVLLTLILLMQKLDPQAHYHDIIKYYDQLSMIDSKRANYYRDQMSKFECEICLCNMQPDERTFTLVGRSLTTLYHTEYLTVITELDISCNKLKELNASVSLLKKLVKLKANENTLVRVDGLFALTRLEHVELDDNNITCPLHITELINSLPSLRFLSLKSNPLSSSDMIARNEALEIVV